MYKQQARKHVLGVGVEQHPSAVLLQLLLNPLPISMPSSAFFKLHRGEAGSRARHARLEAQFHVYKWQEMTRAKCCCV